MEFRVSYTVQDKSYNYTHIAVDVPITVLSEDLIEEKLKEMHPKAFLIYIENQFEVKSR